MYKNLLRITLVTLFAISLSACGGAQESNTPTEQPPATDTDATRLAVEHFLVAPDNVWQGTGDLAPLASAVLDAPVWFFWWD